MKLSSEDLRDILLAAVDDSFTEYDFLRLVRYSEAVATTFLRMKHQRYRTLIEHAGYNFASAGQVCVESLFLPKSMERCHKLRGSLLALTPSPHALPPLTLQNLLHRIIALAVQQSIPLLLAESDPYYKKVLRITQDRLRTSRFEKLEGFHETWYHRSDSELRLELPRFPEDELLAEFSKIARHNAPVATLVEAVFDLLDQQTEYRRVLTVNLVVATVRDFLWLFWEPNDHEEPEFDQSVCDVNLLDLVPQAVSQANSKVLVGYIRRLSLSESEAQLFSQSAEKYLRDLATKDCGSHYEYYSAVFPTVSKLAYRNGKRSLFEYYISVVKNCFFLLAKQKIAP